MACICEIFVLGNIVCKYEQICKEMNKLRPILKFLWYDNDDADADDTQVIRNTSAFL